MRMSAGGIANLGAWAVLAGLAASAVVLVVILGPFGLVVLGLLTLFVCSRFSLDEHAPTWGTPTFKAQLTPAESVEEQAGAAAERQAALSPVRYYFGCGVVLLVAGLGGLAWQHWG